MRPSMCSAFSGASEMFWTAVTRLAIKPPPFTLKYLINVIVFLAVNTAPLLSICLTASSASVVFSDALTQVYASSFK